MEVLKGAASLLPTQVKKEDPVQETPVCPFFVQMSLIRRKRWQQVAHKEGEAATSKVEPPAAASSFKLLIGEDSRILVQLSPILRLTQKVKTMRRQEGPIRCLLGFVGMAVEEAESPTEGIGLELDGGLQTVKGPLEIARWIGLRHGKALLTMLFID